MPVRHHKPLFASEQRQADHTIPAISARLPGGQSAGPSRRPENRAWLGSWPKKTSVHLPHIAMSAQWVVSQSRAARCAAEISSGDISVAISRRSRTASWLPRIAARLNHLWAATRSTASPFAYLIPNWNSRLAAPSWALISSILIIPCPVMLTPPRHPPAGALGLLCRQALPATGTGDAAWLPHARCLIARTFRPIDRFLLRAWCSELRMGVRCGPPGRTEGGCRQNRQRECMPAHCSHSRPPLDLREVKRPLLCPPPYTRVRPARYELSHRTAGQLIGGRNLLFFRGLSSSRRMMRPRPFG